MFEQVFVEGTAKTNKSWTVMVSFGLQVCIVVAGIIIPLLNPEMLPKTALSMMLVAPPPPPPPPPPPAPAQVVKIQRVIPKQFDGSKLVAPKQIPKEIAMIKEDELPPSSGVGVVGGIPGGMPGGGAGGVLGGIIGAVQQAAPPPPPPVKEAPKVVTP